MKHEILLGLTTTPHSDWRGKVEEMKKFGIRRIALFPTFLEIEQRKELYTLLETIPDLEIPHVHLRGQDMAQWEMKWFETHGAVVYNMHMDEPEHESLKSFKYKIYIENHKHRAISEIELRSYGGICLDFQHLEKSKKEFPVVANAIEKLVQEFPIGCCHISALPKFKNKLFRLIKSVGGHYMLSLDELDYVKGYRQYLPQYISIELENSFEQQLKAKKYLEKLLEI